jgi:hypothetical protein
MRILPRCFVSRFCRETDVHVLFIHVIDCIVCTVLYFLQTDTIMSNEPQRPAGPPPAAKVPRRPVGVSPIKQGALPAFAPNPPSPTADAASLSPAFLSGKRLTPKQDAEETYQRPPAQRLPRPKAPRPAPPPTQPPGIPQDKPGPPPSPPPKVLLLVPHMHFRIAASLHAGAYRLQDSRSSTRTRPSNRRPTERRRGWPSANKEAQAATTDSATS